MLTDFDMEYLRKGNKLWLVICIDAGITVDPFINASKIGLTLSARPEITWPRIIRPEIIRPKIEGYIIISANAQI